MAALPGVEELLVTTLFNQSDEIADGYTANNVILFMLKERGRKKKISGGYELREPIAARGNGSAMFFSGYQKLNITPQTSLTAFIYQWKQWAVSVTMSGLEQRQNADSKERLFELMAEKIDIARGELDNLIDQALMSDGTSFDGKQIGGLEYLFPSSATSGTIGGIARSGNTFAQHYTRSTLTDAGRARDATNIVSEIGKCITATKRGTSRINLGLLPDADWDFAQDAMSSKQIYQNAKLAEAGFDTLRVRGCDLVHNGGIRGHATAGTIKLLNTDTLNFKVHRDCDGTPMNPDRYAVDQDAVVKLIGGMGNLTCNLPEANAHLGA